MADTFIPKPGVTYYNITGPNQGVTAGPLRPNNPRPQAQQYAVGGYNGQQLDSSQLVNSKRACYNAG